MIPLRHQFVIIRRTGTGVFDDRNQEAMAEADVATVMGDLQYKGASEMAQRNQAGAALAEVTAHFFAGTDVRGSDVIRHAPDDGRRYEVASIRPDSKGGNHFVKVDATLVEP